MTIPGHDRLVLLGAMALLLVEFQVTRRVGLHEREQLASASRGSGKGGVALPGLRMISQTREEQMLWTIVVVLLILWLLGLVTSYTMGGLIHILLVIALIVILVRVISGRKAL
jgi:uncharacterized protein DUF5670